MGGRPPRRELACLRYASAAVAEPVPGDELRCCYDIDARLENADKMVDVGEHLVIDNAIRLQGKQGIDVIGCQHTEWFDATEFSDIAADFLR